jgi:hypothetical protein
VAKLAATQAGLTQVAAAKVSATQVCPNQVNFPQVEGRKGAIASLITVQQFV